MNKIELGFIVGAISIMMILNLSYMAYLAIFKLPIAESHFSKSTWIQNNKTALAKTGWAGSIYKLNAIAIVLLMPKLSEKRNLIDLAEALAFPKKLKLLILANYASLILLLCCLTTTVALSKT
ncbi:hypothetical protein [Pseudomonas sp. GZD-222]|uniref:hypothetical protein n=1 Tax=Pseudomonas sp. GZD-222 TaxID=3404805 RepID=UPI003BB7C3D5